jgi:UDP-GlcNAc:undecaprenyl-phosphate GlcNAc-1-phosphate transferase
LQDKLTEFAETFTATLILLPVLIHLAPRLGLLDHPDERKQHSGSVPLVGGLSLLGGLLLVSVLRHLGDSRMSLMLAAGIVVAAAGLLDDRWGLSAGKRFVLQTLACAIMVFAADVMLRDFGHLLWPGTLALGWMAVPVTLFCVVGATNAVNMTDGMDGLAASLVLVALSGLAGAMWLGGKALAATPEVPMLTGGLCAFLLFNLRLPWRKQALAFLGDSGTLLLGFVLGWLLVEQSQGVARSIAPVTALWLLAVPLMDTVFVMIKRGRAGKSMVEADREHLHHAFLRSGWSTNQALLLIVLWACLLAGAGLTMQFGGVSERWSFALFLALCGAYYGLMSHVWRVHRFLGRPVR